jgi:TonB family protein
MRRATTSTVGILAAMLIVAGYASVGSAQVNVPYRVIVHPGNEITELSGEELCKIFLKTRVQWSDGKRIEPVDLNASSPTRKVFSTDVHGRSSSAIQAHWQKQVFSGLQVPPLEVGDDSAVIAYVSTHPAAIGYVSATAPLTGVRAVPLTLPPAQISMVDARFTPMARKLRTQGSVVLKIVVGTDGSVTDASVVSGLPHGLTDAAIEAVRKWRFRPALTNNQPVESSINVTVLFNL